MVQPEFTSDQQPEKLKMPAPLERRWRLTARDKLAMNMSRKKSEQKKVRKDEKKDEAVPAIISMKSPRRKPIEYGIPFKPHDDR